MDLDAVVESAVTRMLDQGFDSALVAASIAEQDELNVANNEASLLRSTEDHALTLVGIVDHREASTTLTDLGADSVALGIADLFDRAQLAPQDDANGHSADEVANFKHGPQEGDQDLLAEKIAEILEYRATRTPKIMLEEGAASYRLSRGIVMTSQGTRLTSSVGAYSLEIMGTATENGQSSSFNYSGGAAEDLSTAHAADWFGIGDMLHETENQIDTRQVGEKFVGDVVLSPFALADLLGWFESQISDNALIQNASIYRESVGEAVASPLLTLTSRFDGPGLRPFSGDGFRAPPLDLIDTGNLTDLTPSYYGSRKLGFKHVPTGSGWVADTGSTPRADMVSGIRKGAMVNRLSMGSPGANGDFSGVIKNSFIIEDGQMGQALSDTMIAGNMAKMLMDIAAVSEEHLDVGSLDFPWVLIPGLSFS